MALPREQKEAVVKKVHSIVDEAESVVFVNFHGLAVDDASELRKTLRDEGVEYTVAKKTLVRRVLEGSGTEGAIPELPGELALAYGEPLAAAKGVASFAKKFDGRIRPLGGIFESRYISAEEVKRLAAVPPRDVLYGQLVTVLNAPMQGTVSALNGITQSFVSVLHQIKEQKA